MHSGLANAWPMPEFEWTYVSPSTVVIYEIQFTHTKKRLCHSVHFMYASMSNL